MKKILLFISIVFASSLAIAQTTFTSGDINYIITTDTTVAIGSNPTFVGDAIIPKIVTNNNKTYKVTDVADGAFQNCTGLTSINLPEGMYYIKGGTFSGCSSLKSVTIPASVFIYGDYAFSYCTSLTSITHLRRTPASINELVFYNVFTTNISLTVPLGAVSDYQSANYWKNFTVKLQNFKYSGVNYTPTSDSTAQVGVNTSIFGGGYTSLVGDIIIPNQVVYDDKILIVNSIVGYAFYGSTGMTSISLPSTVKSLGLSSFTGCTGLKSVTVDWANPTDEYLNFGNITTANVTLNIPYGTAELYSTITPWKDFAINELQTAKIAGLNYKFTSDTTIIVGKNLAATGLVNIPNKIIYKGKEYKVTGIESNAFAGSTITGIKFTTETITNARIATVESSNLLFIGKKAFFNCTGLTSIDIPSSVTSIEDSAFANCTALQSVNVNWETPLVISEKVFDGVAVAGVVLNTPSASRLSYSQAAVWENFSLPLSADDLVAKSNVSIYPNPATSFVNVTLLNANSAQLEVLDIKGSLLQTLLLTETENRIEIGSLGAGIYLFKVTTNSNSSTQKVVVE